MGNKLPLLWTYWQAAFTVCWSNTVDGFTDASYFMRATHILRVFIKTSMIANVLYEMGNPSFPIYPN